MSVSSVTYSSPVVKCKKKQELKRVIVTVILTKKKRLNMCFSRHIQCPSPRAITLNHLTSLPSTQLFAMLGGYIFQQTVAIPDR